MTVKELIDILQTLPQDYEIMYESCGDAYGHCCLEKIDDVEVKVKDKLVIIK
jgi:hypothetical protein